MTTDYRIGDCVDVLKEFPENHFDSCVTDPPYGLEFMGKEWDKFTGSDTGIMAQTTSTYREKGFGKLPIFRGYGDAERESYYDFSLGWACEVLRVLKPGAYLLAFGGTRTFHRLTCALEDAGFEIRDCLMWLYGSGFPKSLDVSKAIDKKSGAERTEVGVDEYHARRIPHGRNTDETGEWNYGVDNRKGEDFKITAPATPEAAKWSGWGTALKPAWEPIILARKPLTGTVAENVLEYGTGGLNIDGTRVKVTGERPLIEAERGSGNQVYGDGLQGSKNMGTTTIGRWPANVLLDEEAAKMLDEQSGERPSGESHVLRRGSTTGRTIGYHGADGKVDVLDATYGDSGGASRFFYTAKASRSEREAGLDRMPSKRNDFQRATSGLSQGKNPKTGERSGVQMEPRTNFHPTVKPVDLMRYLVRLVTPPGGTVLDPFLGSGTTLVAARLEGVNALGIEKEAEYEPIIKGRMNYPTPPVESFGDPSPKDGEDAKRA